MVERIVKEQGFMDFFLSRRPSKNDFLDKVEELIDWRPIDRLLTKHYRKRAAADGRPAYPPLPMFKMLLLQRWYNLSDPGLEAAMCDRISFIRFAGLSFESSVPDETTICRFRNELLATGLHHKLLGQINKQLEALGLLGRDGAVVDATIVASSRRSRKVIDVIAQDRAEDEADETPESGAGEAAEGAAGGEADETPESGADEAAEGAAGGEADETPESESGEAAEGAAGGEVVFRVRYSDDEDARWVKKGKRSHYGYKAHIATDGNGFLLGGHATGASRADTKEFERVVEALDLPKGAAVLADKGYTSAANSDVLKERKLADCIMGKAQRGKKLTELAKLRNRIISSYRFVVEQSIGLMKRHYNFGRARYKGCPKVGLELHLIGMALNIKKGVGMLWG
jgi:IS5 family transposase